MSSSEAASRFLDDMLRERLLCEHPGHLGKSLRGGFFSGGINQAAL